MIHLPRSILVIVLASIYVAACFGTRIDQLRMASMLSGRGEVQAATGPSKGQARQTWALRRHMPMLKEVSAPHLMPASTHIRDCLTCFAPARFDKSERTTLATTASMWSFGRACCTNSVVRPK